MTTTKRQQGQEGRDLPSNNRSLVTPVGGDRPRPLFHRSPVNTGRQDVSFTARGFIPDYMSEQAAVMMPETCRTTLELEEVPGRIGMMPPAGSLTKLQAGQELDGGAGGAGSFVTATAFGAKTNG
jgi:hypothetical protein